MVTSIKEGLETLSGEFDYILEDKSESLYDFCDFSTMDTEETATPSEKILSGSIEASFNWTPERERRMSYECFDFPEKTENFDQPLEERHLFPPDSTSSLDQMLMLSMEQLQKNDSSDSEYLKPSSPSTSVACSEAEELLTRFDCMKHQSIADVVTPKVQKKMCTTATTTTAIQFRHPSSTLPSSRFQKLDRKALTGKKVGAYTPEERRERIRRFHEKRKRRVWRKRIKYSCRKKLADDRPRVKGRFVKRQDQEAAAEKKILTTVSKKPPPRSYVVSRAARK